MLCLCTCVLVVYLCTYTHSCLHVYVQLCLLVRVYICECQNRTISHRRLVSRFCFYRHHKVTVTLGNKKSRLTSSYPSSRSFQKVLAWLFSTYSWHSFVFTSLWSFFQKGTVFVFTSLWPVWENSVYRYIDHCVLAARLFPLFDLACYFQRPIVFLLHYFDDFWQIVFAL